MNEIIIESTEATLLQQRSRPFTGGPKPESLIITCSDCTLDRPLSRRFQHQPVFVLRTSGNEVPLYSDAGDEFSEALEEAVCWWQVPNIVVCGHSECRTDLSDLPEPTGMESRGDRRPSAIQSMLQRRSVVEHAVQNAMLRVGQQVTKLHSYPYIEERLYDERLVLSAAFYLHESGLFLTGKQLAAECA